MRKVSTVFWSLFFIILMTCIGISSGLIRITVTRSSLNLNDVIGLGKCENEKLFLFFLSILLALSILFTERNKNKTINIIKDTIKFLSFISLISLIIIIYEMLSKGSLGPWESLFKIIAFERGIWLSLIIFVPIIGFIAGILYLGKTIKIKEEKSYKSTYNGYETRDVIFLLFSITLSLIMILLPHTRRLNPHAITISVDTRYNIEWLKILDKNGVLKGLHILSKTLRPLYLLYIYYLHKVINVPMGTFGDIVLPSIGFILLTTVSAFLYGGWASLLIPLYLGPAFLYGGFQTNLYALSIMYVLFYLIDKKSFEKKFIALATILGLWHPWTLAYLTLTYTFIALIIRRDQKDIIGVILISISWIFTLFVDYILGGFRATPGIVRPGSTPGPNPYFTLLIYVWGTLARPEVLIPSEIYLMLTEEISILNVSAALSFIALPVLNYCGAYRVLLNAPLPLILGKVFESRNKDALNLDEVKYLLLIPIFTAWLYLTVSSVPS